MKFSPWPRSLFGRLVGVLAVGLVLAQGLSAWINWAERDRVLLEAAGMQPVQRIADIVRLLDSLDAAERGRIVRILNVPPLVVTLDRPPLTEAAQADTGVHARMLAAMLRAVLGDRTKGAGGGPRRLGLGSTASRPLGRAPRDDDGPRQWHGRSRPGTRWHATDHAGAAHGRPVGDLRHDAAS